MASHSDSQNLSALQVLREKYPWPNQHPSAQSHLWSLDGGGRWLVKQRIKKRNLHLILEIGSFLGGSVLEWLSISSDVTVIAVDPWPNEIDGSTTYVADYARRQGKSEAMAQQLEQPEGFYHTFLANLWDHRERVIPVRETSPAVLHELHALGLQPDLIYLDSDKQGTEIKLCHELFPDAIMTGDDWEWEDKDTGHSIQKSVIEFCEQNQRHLWTEGATWVIDHQPQSIAFRLRSWRKALKAKHRARKKAA